VSRERAHAAALEGLHVLADDDPRWRLDPVAQARAACDGGAAVVQLRAKRATDRQTLAWAAEIRVLTRQAGLLFLLNDRFDLALAADADGVHLGQGDLPPARVPATARSRLVIGRSTHTAAQVAAARSEPVDYIAFGPVFATASKEAEHPPRGLGRLAQAVAASEGRPVVAIGGIRAVHAASLRAAGAAAVAVISAVAGADDPVSATRALAEALRGAPAP
jgi:thiamine-phosphate pyrophosphorylase